ncbi:hypothetical protein L0128_06270 [candidate division KSB1 bacterium]|nr:hypothetical protein [candidate division KSB1 bacterium]
MMRPNELTHAAPVATFQPLVLEQIGELMAIRARLTGEATLMQQGIVTDPDTQRPYFTGYDYRTLYDWDQYFEAIIQIYMGWPVTYIKNAITIFLDHQQPSGHIARSVPSNEFHDPEHTKPFLAQTALLIARYFGEINWLLENNYFTKMQRYLDYWLNDQDQNQNGLSEWMSGPHTGMDNQHERAGWWLDRISEGVDLNSYLVRECQAFAKLNAWLGKNEIAQIYQKKAEALAARMRELMWHEADGIFYDRHLQTGKPIPVKYVGAFATLWAKIATPEQAQRMIQQYIFNAQEFWSAYPLPALSRSEKWYSQIFLPKDLGCSWRANTWMPTNYYVYHGLRNYSYHQLASLLAAATERLIKKAGNREYFNAETGAGCGLDPFWGWTLLGHFFEYEEKCRVDITAID